MFTSRITVPILLFISGVLFGAAGMFYFLSPSKPVNVKDITVKRLSGEPITHSKFETGGGNIKFTTTAEGKGEIETTIPANIIPEADAWMNKNNCIQPIAGYEYGDLNGPVVGLLYSRRFGEFAAGGGVIGGRKSVTVLVSGSFHF
jgi:hypothetical protein